MKDPRDASRRELLRSTLLGLGTIAGLAACKKPRAVVCVNGGLTPADLAARHKLAYTDTSSDPIKTCTTCQQFVPPASDDRCGRCKVLKGEIHPLGYCKGYTPRA